MKDGRALELMNEVDTILFDKTGTLTRERPEVGRIIGCGRFDGEDILRYAAAAEAKFAHPIAKAILHEFESLGRPLPPIDDSRYHVGYGITVHVEGHAIRVGSARFMDMEGIAIPSVVQKALEAAHREGNTLVMVGVDDALGGAIELQASVRPEVRTIIDGLPRAGSSTSPSSRATTRPRRESWPRAWAWTVILPRCFPPTRQSTWRSCRRRGARCASWAMVSTTRSPSRRRTSRSRCAGPRQSQPHAHIVFMEEGLSKLCDLRDISAGPRPQRAAKLAIDSGAQRPLHRRRFTLGFGVMTSVLTNNVAALAALANGMLPLRRMAHAQTQSQLEQDRKLAAIELGLPANMIDIAEVADERGC